MMVLVLGMSHGHVVAKYSTGAVLVVIFLTLAIHVPSSPQPPLHSLPIPHQQRLVEPQPTLLPWHQHNGPPLHPLCTHVSMEHMDATAQMEFATRMAATTGLVVVKLATGATVDVLLRTIRTIVKLSLWHLHQVLRSCPRQSQLMHRLNHPHTNRHQHRLLLQRPILVMKGLTAVTKVRVVSVTRMLVVVIAGHVVASKHTTAIQGAYSLTQNILVRS
jgi:hypothetical protein